MKVGSFTRTQEPNRNWFTGRTGSWGRNGWRRAWQNVFFWRARALEQAVNDSGRLPAATRGGRRRRHRTNFCCRSV